MELNPVRHLRAAPVAASALTVIAAAAYSAISLFRHEHFGSTIDLAIQDQTIWGYSRFEILPNTILGIPNLLGDHFNPILVTLAPIYWVWNSAEALLVAQGVLLALGGVPIYLWARKSLGELAGLAFQVSYLVFWGLLAGVLFDFHHVVFAVVAIAAALFATVERRNRLLWAMVVVAMLTREDIALTLIALGFYIFAFQRRFVLGLVLIGINTAWFALLLGVVMPALASTPYQHWTYDALGTGPSSAILHVLRHPLDSLELMFKPLKKTQVWVGLLGNWLFLPLISPLAIIAIPTFLGRFWSSDANLWSFQFQYSMVAAPILTFAAIDGATRIRSMWKGRMLVMIGRAAAIGVMATTIVASVVINPFNELATYMPSSMAADVQACLDVIPSTAAVASTPGLLPHLSHRRDIYPIPTNEDVDDIAIDLYSGGDSDDQLRTLVADSVAHGYGVACARNLTLVLAKGTPGKPLTGDLQRWLAGECDGRACLSASR